MGSPTRNRRILLVGRDHYAAERYTRILVDAGYEVLVAQDALTVRRALEGPRIDIMVQDLAPLVFGGAGLLEEVRLSYGASELPVIVLARIGSETLIEAALAAGANRFLTKPVRRTVLLAAVDVTLAECELARVRDQQEALLVGLTTDGPVAPFNELDGFAIDWDRLPQPTPTGQHVVDTGVFCLQTPELSPGHPGETAELEDQDWGLFLAIEGAISQSIEQGRPLSLLVVEAGTADGLSDGGRPFEANLSEQLRATLRPDQRISKLESTRCCVTLPDADEMTAVRTAERIVATCREAARSGQMDLRVGVATLDRHHQGTPFQLIEWANKALERARQGRASGWCLHRPDPVYYQS